MSLLNFVNRFRRRPGDSLHVQHSKLQDRKHVNRKDDVSSCTADHGWDAAARSREDTSWKSRLLQLREWISLKIHPRRHAPELAACDIDIHKNLRLRFEHVKRVHGKSHLVQAVLVNINCCTITADGRGGSTASATISDERPLEQSFSVIQLKNKRQTIEHSLTDGTLHRPAANPLDPETAYYKAHAILEKSAGSESDNGLVFTLKKLAVETLDNKFKPTGFFLNNSTAFFQQSPEGDLNPINDALWFNVVPQDPQHDTLVLKFSNDRGLVLAPTPEEDGSFGMESPESADPWIWIIQAP